VVTPIMANNQVYGVLEVFDKQDGKPFHRNEVAFINQVALKLALVIQNTHAYMTINRLNEGLEHKVRERTSQLEQAITSLQETQAQLMQSEKLATIGTLAGGVAHELNNPLAAILANVQLLRLDAEDEDTLESLALIESGAKRCKHIVENLLNYARQSAPEYRSFSVNDVMRDTLDLLQHQLRHADIDLVLELGDVAPVIGVATELGQVFTNLVVNALDALAERPRRGKLAIRSQLAGKLVVVEVQDDGGGIEEHVLNRIFDPFFTTKQVGKGTGLGLSVSQQIAVNFGGRIEAASRPGDGSTFRVVLPAASAS
jgi:C4-dicarboxylate-specific signal transduction histidine kinase